MRLEEKRLSFLPFDFDLYIEVGLLLTHLEGNKDYETLAVGKIYSYSIKKTSLGKCHKLSVNLNHWKFHLIVV